MMVMMYFMVMATKETTTKHQEMVNQMKKGDQVVTIGGLRCY